MRLGVRLGGRGSKFDRLVRGTLTSSSSVLLGQRRCEFVRDAQIPEEVGEAAGDHEDGEVPERCVEHACGAAEEYEQPGQFVGDGFLAELHGGEEDDADGSGVEARQEGVDGGGEAGLDVLDAEGEGVHAYCSGKTVRG